MVDQKHMVRADVLLDTARMKFRVHNAIKHRVPSLIYTVYHCIYMRRVVHQKFCFNQPQNKSYCGTCLDKSRCAQARAEDELLLVQLLVFIVYRFII